MPNIKHYFRWFFYFLIFSAVAIVQATFISSLPPIFFAINLVLTSLLFSLIFFKLENTLILAILMGFWLDILGFNFFGLNILVYLITSLLMDFLLKNWLTNKSLYSFLVLSVVGVLIYNLLLYIILAVWQSGQTGSGFFLFESHFWIQLLWQTMWGAGFMLFFFNIANSLSKRLKPFFLEKK